MTHAALTSRDPAHTQGHWQSRSDGAGVRLPLSGRLDGHSAGGFPQLFVGRLREAVIANKQHLRELLLGGHLAQRARAHALIHELEEDSRVYVGSAQAEKGLEIVLELRIWREALQVQGHQLPAQPL